VARNEECVGNSTSADNGTVIELAHCLLQYYLCQLGQKQAGQEKGVAFVESSLGAVEFEQK
jgi:hypothetical protein